MLEERQKAEGSDVLCCETEEDEKSRRGGRGGLI